MNLLYKNAFRHYSDTYRGFKFCILNLQAKGQQFVAVNTNICRVNQDGGRSRPFSYSLGHSESTTRWRQEIETRADDSGGSGSYQDEYCLMDRNGMERKSDDYYFMSCPALGQQQPDGSDYFGSRANKVILRERRHLHTDNQTPLLATVDTRTSELYLDMRAFSSESTSAVFTTPASVTTSSTKTADKSSKSSNCHTDIGNGLSSLNGRVMKPLAPLLVVEDQQRLTREDQQRLPREEGYFDMSPVSQVIQNML